MFVFAKLSERIIMFKLDKKQFKPKVKYRTYSITLFHTFICCKKIEEQNEIPYQAYLTLVQHFSN